MSRTLRSDEELSREWELPLNREERRKKRWRPEEDLHSNRSSTADRLRDTRSRAAFVRRLGPR